VIQNLLPPNAIELITRLVVSASFKQPRIYDLHLDHWYFTRNGVESFRQMCTRIRPLVAVWWNGPVPLPGQPQFPPHNGFYDNSVSGVNDLSNFTGTTAPDIFYFAMSFDATQQFPNVQLSVDELNSLPVNRVISALDFFGLRGFIGNIVTDPNIPFNPSTLDLARWFVRVANGHLGGLGYFDKIPFPGARVPRPDMLPFLTLFSIVMGGYDIPENPVGLPNITSADFQPNDGVVNTLSMSGPEGSRILDAARFPTNGLGSMAQAIATNAPGTYWHFGENHTMDHADQIGVFTEGQTVSLHMISQLKIKRENY
jgi:hypothetical protein